MQNSADVPGAVAAEHAGRSARFYEPSRKAACEVDAPEFARILRTLDLDEAQQRIEIVRKVTPACCFQSFTYNIVVYGSSGDLSHLNIHEYSSLSGVSIIEILSVAFAAIAHFARILRTLDLHEAPQCIEIVRKVNRSEHALKHVEHFPKRIEGREKRSTFKNALNHAKHIRKCMETPHAFSEID